MLGIDHSSVGDQLFCYSISIVFARIASNNFCSQYSKPNGIIQASARD
jgi:hypothetical protein